MDDAVGSAKKRGGASLPDLVSPFNKIKGTHKKKGGECKICIIQAVQQAISFVRGGNLQALPPWEIRLYREENIILPTGIQFDVGL